MLRVNLKNVWLKCRSGLLRFPQFHPCALALAALSVLYIHGCLPDKTLFDLSRGILLGVLAGLSVQLFLEWRGLPARRSLAGGAAVLVGALAWWFWHSVHIDSPRYWFGYMLYCGMAFALVAATVALLYHLADGTTLFARLVLNGLVVSGISGVFALSQMLCLCAFDRLVMPVNAKIYGDLAAVSWILISMVGFLSLLPGRGERGGNASDRAIAILFWVLLPAYLILLAILYLYLGRVVATWSMPSGELNWFGSAALAAYVFFWLSLRDSSRRFFRLFVRWGWVLLVPVLIAQVVGIVIRYRAYGLTAPRMAGQVTLLIGVAALFLAALNRRPASLFGLIAVTGLVFTVTPLNIIDIPVCNQERRLRAALERNGLLSAAGELQLREGLSLADGDAETIVGAWKYLKDNRAAVWHRQSFLPTVNASVVQLCRARNVKKVELPDLLGIDASKFGKGRNQNCFASVRLDFPSGCDLTASVEDYSRVRIPRESCLGCLREGERWFVRIPPCGERGTERFDVTDHVNSLLESVRCRAKFAEPYKSGFLQTKDAVWRLSSEKELLFRSVYASGNVGERCSRVNLNGCILLEK